MRRFLRELRFFIFPQICFNCRKIIYSREPFCEDCAFLIRFVAGYDIFVGAKKITVLSAFCYEDPIKKLILAKNRKNIVGISYQADLICKFLFLENVLCDYIVPVPLHWSRYAKRGFNQSEVIAQYVGNFLKRPVENILKKIKKTRFQAELGFSERQDNVKNVFKLRSFTPELFRKNILLVDDLATTGATLRAASKELLKLKPDSLTILVTCKTL